MRRVLSFLFALVASLFFAQSALAAPAGMPNGQMSDKKVPFWQNVVLVASNDRDRDVERHDASSDKSRKRSDRDGERVRDNRDESPGDVTEHSDKDRDRKGDNKDDDGDRKEGSKDKDRSGK